MGGIWDVRPYLEDAAHRSEALESCHEKRPSAVGSRNTGRAREEKQTKDPEQSRTLSCGDGSYCGASRDNIKEPVDKDGFAF